MRNVITKFHVGQDGLLKLEIPKLRAELEKSGILIGPNDLQIAAVALRHGVTLVTYNTREFSRVPDLSIEDWEIDRIE